MSSVYKLITQINTKQMKTQVKINSANSISLLLNSGSAPAVSGASSAAVDLNIAYIKKHAASKNKSHFLIS